ncbi:cytosine permease [Mobilicoccus caccae]|nr:cytosine permease [Mobilicoccus caccae]
MTEKRRSFVEQRALTAVPAGERQHWLAVAAIQAGYMVSVTSLWTGALIVTSMTLTDTIVAGTIGYLIVVGLSVLMGMQGSDLGVPTIEASTSAFGEKGAQWLISALLIASLIGWFAINAGLVGAAFSGLLSESFGVDVPVIVSTIGWGLIMLATAVVGFGGLKILNAIGVPIMIVVCAIGVWVGIRDQGLAALQEVQPDGKMTMVAAIGVVVGGYAVGALTAADVTRYQRTRVDVAKAVTLGIRPPGSPCCGPEPCCLSSPAVRISQRSSSARGCRCWASSASSCRPGRPTPATRTPRASTS